MPTIAVERCTGCGACIAACPTGAMRLADDRAIIAESLCQHCGACIAACPMEAIAWKPDEERAIEIKIPPSPLSLAQREPSRWRIVAGAALSLLGREILPRAVEWMLARWDERQAASPRSASKAATTSGQAQPEQPQTSLANGEAERHHRHRHGHTS